MWLLIVAYNKPDGPNLMLERFETIEFETEESCKLAAKKFEDRFANVDTLAVKK